MQENKNSFREADCECRIIHEDLVQSTKSRLLEEDIIYEMSDIFKVMGDPTRLKIINALIISELCVCELSELMEMSQPAVSHHLKALRQCRLVKYRRDGKSAYYSLDDRHINELFNTCLNHVSE